RIRPRHLHASLHPSATPSRPHHLLQHRLDLLCPDDGRLRRWLVEGTPTAESRCPASTPRLAGHLCLRHHPDCPDRNHHRLARWPRLDNVLARFSRFPSEILSVPIGGCP